MFIETLVESPDEYRAMRNFNMIAPTLEKNMDAIRLLFVLWVLQNPGTMREESAKR